MEDQEIVINPVLVAKIQSYMNSSLYTDLVENAATFNSRLGIDRASRLPFLDSQTGVAQNHSTLWMDARQRLPGFREGQIYSYPSKRWKKKRRQYLTNFMQPRYPPGITKKEVIEEEKEVPSVIEAMTNTNSSGSTEEVVKEIPAKEETKPPEAWFYDELDIPDTGDFEEPDVDSDYDYEDSYNKRKKKKVTPKTPKTSSTRGRRKITYDAVTDPDKPFSCDLCGARYKTRPGLTYHYSHSHKEKEEGEEEEETKKDDVPASSSSGRRQNNRGGGGGGGGGGGVGVGNNSNPPTTIQPSFPPPILHPQQQQQMSHPLTQLQPPTLELQHPGPPPHHMGMSLPPHPLMHSFHPPPHLYPQQPPPHPPHHPLLHPPPPHIPHPSQQQLISHQPHQQMSSSPLPYAPPPHSHHAPPLPPPHSVAQHEGRSEEEGRSKESEGSSSGGRGRVQPSHYCDFCLGDANENKKSGGPEELVSCSDCGRSGHPSCLQFTANMIISVKKYRWQCIECKCCSLCGNSDNDDQLLFCDDCDRGYHMYCLKPPLEAPPEGSWSCTLCIAEFHQK